MDLGLMPVASPKWAITSASIGSVLARWPIALAKARICAGCALQVRTTQLVAVAAKA